MNQSNQKDSLIRLIIFSGFGLYGIFECYSFLQYVTQRGFKRTYLIFGNIGSVLEFISIAVLIYSLIKRGKKLQFFSLLGLLAAYIFLFIGNLIGPFKIVKLPYKLIIFILLPILFYIKINKQIKSKKNIGNILFIAITLLSIYGIYDNIIYFFRIYEFFGRRLTLPAINDIVNILILVSIILLAYTLNKEKIFKTLFMEKPKAININVASQNNRKANLEDEKKHMNYSFEKYGMGFGPWEIDDDKITYKGKEYPLKDITKVKYSGCKENPGLFGKQAGSLTIQFGPLQSLSLMFKPAQVNQAYDVYQKLLPIAQAYRNHEYRKKCNVCGAVFCYTNQDLHDDAKNALLGIVSATGGIASAASGRPLTATAMNNQSMIITDKITDKNKCPRCGSRDLEELSEDDWKKIVAESNQNSQNPTSVADEILKFKQLLDCGAITQEEFDKKKAELLKK